MPRPLALLALLPLLLGGCYDFSGLSSRYGMCSNGIKDELETDVDCGGSICPSCSGGKACGSKEDCLSLACVDNKCRLQLGFASTVGYALPTAGQGPSGIATADFDNDGVLDLVVSNLDTDNVAFFKGASDGTFDLPTFTTCGNAPTAIVAGDFDGDTLSDFATSNYYNTVSVGLTVSGGMFNNTNYPVDASTNSYSIVAADWNNDTHLDLSAGASGIFSLQVLQNDGKGAFSKLSGVPVSDYSMAVAAGDFNLDGKPDLVATLTSTTTAAIALGKGNGAFDAPISYDVLVDAYAVVVGDWNGDGKPDLAFGGNDSNGIGNVSILLGNGNGGFQPAVKYATVPTPYGMAVEDFDKDGELDIAVISHIKSDTQNDSCGILLGVGDGTFVNSNLDLPVGRSPWAITAGDFNKDGKPDLATANYRTHSISVLLNNSM